MNSNNMQEIITRNGLELMVYVINYILSKPPRPTPFDHSSSMKDTNSLLLKSIEKSKAHNGRHQSFLMPNRNEPNAFLRSQDLQLEVFDAEIFKHSIMTIQLIVKKDLSKYMAFLMD